MSGHGDEEGVFAADHVAEAAEDRAPKGRTAKPAAKAEQHEDEASPLSLTPGTKVWAMTGARANRTDRSHTTRRPCRPTRRR